MDLKFCSALAALKFCNQHWIFAIFPVFYLLHSAHWQVLCFIVAEFSFFSLAEF